jgi:hypothetical protein
VISKPLARPTDPYDLNEHTIVDCLRQAGVGLDELWEHDDETRRDYCCCHHDVHPRVAMRICRDPLTSARSVPSTFGIIQGTVTAGPTCAVEQADHPCPPRPVSGAVSASRADGTTLTGKITRDGPCRITVPAGTYTMTVQTGTPLPTCPPATIGVSAGVTVHSNIVCETGIR